MDFKELCPGVAQYSCKYPNVSALDIFKNAYEDSFTFPTGERGRKMCGLVIVDCGLKLRRVGNGYMKKKQ
jgi:hypothetical protein